MKMRAMMNPKQHLVIKHSGCGSLINIIDKQGSVTYKYSFKSGKVNREFSMSNGMSKTIYTIDGNKLIYEQNGKKQLKIVREFSLTHCIATYTVDKIVARKIFTAQNRGTYSIGF